VCIIVVIGVVQYFSGASQAERRAQVSQVLDMAESDQPSRMDEVLDLVESEDDPMVVAQNDGPVRGAPLDAPVEEDDTATKVPQAPSMSNPRVIPESSWDAVKKLEAQGDGKNLYDFDTTKDGKYKKVTFRALGSYEYEVPDPQEIRESADPTKVPEDQVPAEIKGLDGEPVVLAGFMVPIELTRDGEVVSFALTQDQMFCCYGVPPKMHEWVMVEMADGETAPFSNDLPVATFGELTVGEEIEDGYVLSLYRMKGTKVMDARELLKQAQSGS
jgi:hypothetical protein